MKQIESLKMLNKKKSRYAGKTTNILFVLILLILLSESFAQTVYEVTPGTKGNEIVLTVANVSEENSAQNVSIVLTKKSSSLTFSKETETIEMIDTKAEAEAKFTFDVERKAPITQKDTIEFMITSSDGIMMMKSFIFSYTGPKEFKLEQNYPNPFNPATSIQYQVSSISTVSLKVYDILGREVATLVNEEQQPGYYEVQFNGSSLASGLYIYRLQAGSFVSVKKMMMVK
ncbi:T9SS type A sorting domain-containing protein [Schleiferia thermophila]